MSGHHGLRATGAAGGRREGTGRAFPRRRDSSTFLLWWRSDRFWSGRRRWWHRRRDRRDCCLLLGGGRHEGVASGGVQREDRARCHCQRVLAYRNIGSVHNFPRPRCSAPHRGTSSGDCPPTAGTAAVSGAARLRDFTCLSNGPPNLVCFSFGEVVSRKSREIPTNCHQKSIY